MILFPKYIQKSSLTIHRPPPLTDDGAFIVDPVDGQVGGHLQLGDTGSGRRGCLLRRPRPRHLRLQLLTGLSSDHSQRAAGRRGGGGR